MTNRKIFSLVTPEDVDPVDYARNVVGFAVNADACVNWKHGDRFEIVVRPDMTYKEVECMVGSQDDVNRIFVRWVGDDTEDVTLLMDGIDRELREADSGRFVVCCDTEDGDCGICCDSSKSLPVPFPDGTYAIAPCGADGNIGKIHGVLARYPKVEVVN